LAADQSRRIIADSQHQLNIDLVLDEETDEEPLDKVKYELRQQDGWHQKDRFPQLAVALVVGVNILKKGVQHGGKRAMRVMVLTILPQSVVARKSMSLTPLIQARDT
jgi:hypothetical protein